MSKPALLAINKIDIPGSDVLLEKFLDQLSDIKGEEQSNEWQSLVCNYVSS